MNLPVIQVPLNLSVSEMLLKSHHYRHSVTDIRLIFKRNRQIKPLVEAVLVNELRLLETGIRQTEERVQEFEENIRCSRKSLSLVVKMMKLKRLWILRNGLVSLDF